MTDLTDLLIQEGKQVGMYPISEDSFLDMGRIQKKCADGEKIEFEIGVNAKGVS